MNFTVTLDDGRSFPLTECDWALLRPCGCPEAIMHATGAWGDVIGDESGAWKQLYDLGPERERETLRRVGWTVKLMPIDEAVAAFMAKCPHREVVDNAGA